ncbi:MAG: O-antigen ligase family protein [Limisphaerales bacterium]
MKSRPQPEGATDQELLPSIFAGLFGAALGLALLKFGNPPITEKWVTAPANYWEFLLGYPWPIVWAYWLLVPVGAFGIAVARWKPVVPWWLVGLPLLWLVWQFMAGARSVAPALTTPTLRHFAACVVCFYLGYFSLSRVRRLWLFWLGLLCGFVLVLAVGWEQQFGGLKETRDYFFQEVYPYMKDVAPEYLKKISSNRIFSTLFYPNALAGVLLLLLPVTLAALWQLRAWFTPAARWFLMALAGTVGLGCLYWSGSKGGWLLMLLVGLAALLRVPFSRRFKVALVIGVLFVGLAGFFWKHAAFFQKGATSVSARFDYWRAAAQTARDNPVFGTGPGTFAIAYQKIKRPESEMARLVHNDYLEQASDSGLPGLLAYVLFIVTTLASSFPKAGQTAATRAEDWLVFSVWLGVLGWSLQSLVEFGLYIPALAWPAFTLLGWLLGRRRPMRVETPRPVTKH